MLVLRAVANTVASGRGTSWALSMGHLRNLAALPPREAKGRGMRAASHESEANVVVPQQAIKSLSG